MKICDFKWSELNQKVETPAISKNLTIEKKTIPVFFIENKIFELFDGEDFYEIFTQKLKQFVKDELLNNPKRIQIDCDWTLNTKKNYFHFLTLLKDKFEIEVTLRLHQIKHSKITGIPDVDCGVLMIYNLRKPAILKQLNSIYDYELAISYLKDNLTKYPMNLKIALPAFSWGVHFQHGKMKGLINNTIFEDYKEERFEYIKPNLFKSKTVFYLKNHPINKRDMIRYEAVNPPELRKMIKYLKKNIKQDSLEIILFSLDSKFFNKNYNSYEKIISDFN